MPSDLWKQRASWTAMVAAILFTGAIAQAQPEKSPPGPDHHRTDAEHQGYWLGLIVDDVSDELRSQLKLPEGQGLVVKRVAPGSPAEKAGIAANDVLLKSGDTSLSEVEDLMQAVAHSEGKSLSITLVRGGEHKTIDVTPAKRGEGGPNRFFLGEAPPLADRLFRVLRPGLPIELEFPKDLHVTIHKEGDQPGKVSVERGDKKWEVTDKTLNELPNEVRGYVEMYLGKMPTPPLPPEVEEQLSHALPLPPGVPPDMERHLRREAGRLERRLGEEALPRIRDLQDHLRDVERRLEERLRDVERRLEDRRDAPPGRDDRPGDDSRI